jgi:hypothetical protein
VKGADAHGSLDYEQQRRDLLRKHGIDLEDGNQDGTKTRRIDRKDLEKIMGEGPGGVFTWREKNRKKVRTVRDICQCLTSTVPSSPTLFAGRIRTVSRLLHAYVTCQLLMLFVVSPEVIRGTLASLLQTSMAFSP